MTNKRDPNTRTWAPITLRIDPETAEALKMLARKDRRSTQNLVNKVLAEFVEGMKGGENNE